MAVDPKVNAILYLRFGRVHIGLTLYHYRNKKQHGYKKAGNIKTTFPACSIISFRITSSCLQVREFPHRLHRQPPVWDPLNRCG